MNQFWHQNFDPLGNPLLSTLAAAVPVCTLFYFLAVRRTPAWRAAVYAFAAAVVQLLNDDALWTRVAGAGREPYPGHW